MIVKDMGGPNRNELDLKVVPGPLDGAVGTRGIIKNHYCCCRHHRRHYHHGYL